MPTIKFKNKDGKSYYSLLPNNRDYSYFVKLLKSGMDPEIAYKITVETIGKNRHKGKIPTLRMSNGRLFMDMAKWFNFNFTDCAIFRKWNKKLGDPEKAFAHALNNRDHRNYLWEIYRNETNNKIEKNRENTD